MDGNEGYTVDQALEVLNGTSQSEPESNEQQPVEGQESDDQQQQEQVDSQPDDQQQNPKDQQPDEEPEQPETKSPDFNQVIKFKENGQEVELTLSQLIERAQKGSNYDRHMQSLVAQQKAYEVAMQQQQQQQQHLPAPEEKLKTLQQQLDEYASEFKREYGMEFNPWEPSHMAAFNQHTTQKQARELAERQTRDAQVREYQTQERRYASVIESNWKDPEVEKINEFALQSFYSLPSKGADGIAEFNALYPIYQKIQQRDAHWRGEKVNLQPFTAAEVDTIEKFMNKCKAEYGTKKQKDAVKDQVPKSVPIKPTVKVEPTGGDPAPAKKIDFKKLQSMDIDDIAKLL